VVALYHCVSDRSLKNDDKVITSSLFYMYLEHYEVNIARVRNRVLNGGHDVPKEDIIRIFYWSKKLFWAFYKDLGNSQKIIYQGNPTDCPYHHQRFVGAIPCGCPDGYFIFCELP